jgi:hypothetical protein
VAKIWKGDLHQILNWCGLFFSSLTRPPILPPIVNCQIVNNCCHDKDLKEIFKSDAIRLVVSFKSLSMQISSIYKCKPVNMYIIVAMAKNLKGSFWQMQIAKSCLSQLWQGDPIVNNYCYGKDLKEIFESDSNRLEVSFWSLTMQSSSIPRLNFKQHLLIIFKYVYN